MTFFFVDDDPLVIKSFQRTFKRHSSRFDVRFFLTCEEALERLDEDCPSICFADRKMPFMDGEEFLRRVKEWRPAVLRVLISGDAPGKRSKGNYDLFLEKPVSTAMLMGVIDKRVNGE